MAKLNYLNRKSEGVKLGAIVAKDLRKRCKSSTSTKTEAHKDTSPLEIILEAKNLTDEGLHEASQGLSEALAHPETTRLAVLNLARNGLTAKSLQSLAEPLKLACPDLEDLDLSGNAIGAATREEAEPLEAFLDSLRYCRKLKKINLSENQLSGSLVLEVFARAYMRQFDENVNLIERTGDGVPDTVQEISDDMQELGIDTAKSEKAARFSPCGLPTIISIDMASCSITDAGALWLSSVIPRHSWAVSTLWSGSTGTGIICWPNERLSPIGAKVLHQAEAAIYDSFTGREISRNGQSAASSRRTGSSPSHNRHKSIDGHAPATSSTGRNPSPQHNPVEELCSSRRKIQRTILEDRGAATVDLWHASLGLLTLTRRILGTVSVPQSPASSSPVSHNRHTDSDSQSSPISTRSTYANGHVKDARDSSPIQPHTYASRLVLPTNERMDFSIKPAVLRPRKRRDSFSVGSDRSTPSVLAVYAAADDDTLDMSVSAISSTSTATFAVPIMVGPLPLNAWEVILPLLADPHDVLNKAQRTSVMAYGRDRRTLVGETETIGKAKSVQVYKVLEGMGVLGY